MRVFRDLRQKFMSFTPRYRSKTSRDIVFSYSQKHYMPNVAPSEEYAFMSAHLVAKHMYESLAAFGEVYYADEPGATRARLFVTENNWSRGRLVNAPHTILFLPKSHLGQRREQFLHYTALCGIAPERIVGCTPADEVEQYCQGLARAERIIIFGNETIKQTYLSHGVPEAKLILLNSGINYEHFLPQARTHETIRFVFPATYPTLGKGFPFLMEAWQHLQIKHPHRPISLDILGDRGRRDVDVEQYLAFPNVRFHGKYLGGSQEHLDKLAHAHYVVFPSLSEGQASTLLEAMSCGCVPIATRESGIDADRYGGWIIEAGSVESIYQCLTDVIRQHATTTWEEHSRQTRRQIETHHDWERAYRKPLRALWESYL